MNKKDSIKKKVAKKKVEKIKKLKEKKESESQPSKKQVESQNKLLKNVFIVLGFLIIALLVAFSVINSTRNFEYKDINFDIVRTGEVVLYHTAVPIYSGTDGVATGRHVADYNVYLRKDPRELRYLTINEDIRWSDILVLNATDSFTCEGDGIIAVANFQQVLNTFGTKVVKDPNATCDSQGRYLFVNMQLSDGKTNIEQLSPSCYNFNIANCEILEVTEKFIVEKIAKVDDGRVLIRN